MRDDEAGGNKRRHSLMTARVYGRVLRRCGDEARRAGTAGREGPKTEECSARRRARAGGCWERRWRA